jgi:hypothetical protein
MDATTSANALKTKQKYTPYDAVTIPPELLGFEAEFDTARKLRAPRIAGEMPPEGYHPE